MMNTTIRAVGARGDFIFRGGKHASGHGGQKPHPLGLRLGGGSRPRSMDLGNADSGVREFNRQHDHCRNGYSRGHNDCKFGLDGDRDQSHDHHDGQSGYRARQDGNRESGNQVDLDRIERKVHEQQDNRDQGENVLDESPVHSPAAGDRSHRIKLRGDDKRPIEA